MYRALVMARYSAAGAAGVLKEGLAGRRKMIESVVEANDARLVDFYAVSGGEWNVAYIMEGEFRAEGEAQNAASALIAKAGGGLEDIRIYGLTDVSEVDGQLSDVMQSYRPPGD